MVLFFGKRRDLSLRLVPVAVRVRGTKLLLGDLLLGQGSRGGRGCGVVARAVYVVPEWEEHSIIAILTTPTLPGDVVCIVVLWVHGQTK